MSKTITPSAARNILLGLWFAFLLLNLGIALYLYFDNWIEDDTLWNALSQLNSVYVTYLGVMIAFYFAGHVKVGRPLRKTGAAFSIAVAGSVLWNVIVVSFVLKAFLLRGDRQNIYGLEDATKQIGRIVPLLSWIVAPAIGYYFGNSTTEKR